MLAKAEGLCCRIAAGTNPYGKTAIRVFNAYLSDFLALLGTEQAEFSGCPEEKESLNPLPDQAVDQQLHSARVEFSGLIQNRRNRGNDACMMRSHGHVRNFHFIPPPGLLL
jgi:hypothetical protein